MTEEELKELEEEIAQLEAEGKKISVQNKMKLKKLQRKRDKVQSPIEPSSVFVSEYISEDIVKLIDINKIQMPIFNDRTGIDEKKIEELAHSIKENGLLQPIVLKENNDGTFTKISGRRRILASKLNGEKSIRALIRKDELSQRKFNLLVLHENTQREDLSVYDKVRFILNFIEQELNISQLEAIKLSHRINNYKKGNLIEEDYELKKISEVLEKILIDTKIFSSIPTLVRHLSVLDMNVKTLEFLDTNKITFNMALVFNQYKNKKFINDRTFDSIVEEIISKEMSINEAKSYFKTLLYKEEKAVQNQFFQSAKTKLSKLNKIILQLDEKKLKDFETELEKLISAYQ